MVFVSFEVEKMRMFLVQSMLGLSAVVGCSSLLSRVKPLAKGWFQLAPVSWPSCRQQAWSCMGMEELPSLFCYKFFFYSKFWATDAVFLKV